MTEPDGIPAIISRRDAKAAGLTHYSTAKPCIRGHTCQRAVSSKKCVMCSAERMRRRRAENPERERKAHRAYYSRNRKLVVAKNCAYALAHPTEVFHRQRCYRLRVAERRRLYHIAWRSENRTACIANANLRRARKPGAEGFFTPADIKRIFGLQRGKCPGCRKPLGAKFDVDHITPLAKGGTNWPRNLQLMCGRATRVSTLAIRWSGAVARLLV